MKFSFHQNPDADASPNTIAVFQAEGPSFGQPATPEQIDKLLQVLNMPETFIGVLDEGEPGEE